MQVRGRNGFLNPVLYGLLRSGPAYSGSAAPIRSIPYGDNWYHDGSNGYNPAAGVASLDAANFAKLLGQGESNRPNGLAIAARCELRRLEGAAVFFR